LGAKVLAVDLSEAVEANYDNCHHYEGYSVIQADILNLPVALYQFDVVICIGVIQHTPNPEKTIAALCGYVKPGGLLVIDHYTYNYPFTTSRKILRSLLIKTPPSFSLNFCRSLVAVLWPLHKFFWNKRRSPLLERLRTVFVAWSPVIDYHYSYAELGDELLYAWAMLDTHDTLTDFYKHLRSAEEIEMTLQAAGMVDIEVTYAGNGVEARARKPLKTL
jgi:SAM-dependent methyltransferase